jgi:hypothetical protein
LGEDVSLDLDVLVLEKIPEWQRGRNVPIGYFFTKPP